MSRTVSRPPSRLFPADMLRLASTGLRTRKVRAALSALGIAVGVAAITAVLGLSASSQAGLLAQIDQLGTNLLTVSNGRTIGGDPVELSADAPAMVRRIGPVTDVQYTGATDANAFRSPLIPETNTNGIDVRATSLDLLGAVGTSVAQGAFLNAGTATQPVAVLGSTAAQRLGITTVNPGQRLWVGDRWFYLAGILNPAVLAPDIDSSVLVGFPAAHQYLGHGGKPSTIYVRTTTEQVTAVHKVLAATANPHNPSEVTVSRPSDALVARAHAEAALDGLFLGLGAISLFVGGVGVANIMIISVLERRTEIGLRRALGATRRHIRVQFLTEAMLLAFIGGAVGVLFGAAATAAYARGKDWAIVIPPLAWAGGLASALLIGAIAGLLPAIRAARMTPTQALWSF